MTYWKSVNAGTTTVPADRKRLECGNYFMERRDAELVRDCVRSVVRLNRDKDARR
ncbi:hypothetical protein NXX23_17715 [Bacteroides ovatus]|nr:hypothetical protein [Bacteroides ovatus]